MRKKWITCTSWSCNLKYKGGSFVACDAQPWLSFIQYLLLHNVYCVNAKVYTYSLKSSKDVEIGLIFTKSMQDYTLLASAFDFCFLFYTKQNLAVKVTLFFFIENMCLHLV